jgi:hypothetical protein
MRLNALLPEDGIAYVAQLDKVCRMAVCSTINNINNRSGSIRRALPGWDHAGFNHGHTEGFHHCFTMSGFR